jgi:hypothetical protein
MARWSANKGNFTLTAVADTTNFTDNGYLALQGGSATQRINVLEVSLNGAASASAPTLAVFARASVIGATSTSGGLLTQLDTASAALAAPPLVFSVSTTKPQRSSTLQIGQWAFNAFGGIYRWVAAPGEEIGILGNGNNAGELDISSLNAGTPGLMGATMIFEPF